MQVEELVEQMLTKPQLVRLVAMILVDIGSREALVGAVQLALKEGRLTEEQVRSV